MNEASGEVELRSPEMVFFKEDRADSRVTADHGVVREKSGDIQMRGNVVAVSKKDATTLRTEALDYVAKVEEFQTDQPVLVTRPGGRMRGRGLRASRDLSEIRVLRQETDIQ